MQRRTHRWLVHFIAECKECNWSTQDYLTGPKAAAAHARKTGHLVHGEAGYAINYNEQIEIKR